MFSRMSSKQNADNVEERWATTVTTTTTKMEWEWERMTYLGYHVLDDRIAHFMRKPCDWSTFEWKCPRKNGLTMNRAEICNKISLKLFSSEYIRRIFDNNSDRIASFCFYRLLFVTTITTVAVVATVGKKSTPSISFYLT